MKTNNDQYRTRRLGRDRPSRVRRTPRSRGNSTCLYCPPTSGACQVLNDKPVLEPSLTVVEERLLAHTWANFNLNNSYASYAQDNKKEFSEVDLTRPTPPRGQHQLAHRPRRRLRAVPVPEPDAGVGLGSNAVSKAYPGTHEVYASIGLPSVFLAPTLQVNYDFDSANGAYANFGISQGFELVKDKASLVASASIGAATSKYNEYYFGTKKNAFNDAIRRARAADHAARRLVGQADDPVRVPARQYDPRRCRHPLRTQGSFRRQHHRDLRLLICVL